MNVDSITEAVPSSGLRYQTRWFAIGVPIFLMWIFANVDKVGIAFVATERTFLSDMGISNRVSIGLLLSSFSFAYVFGNFFWGFIVDRIGARMATIISAVLWSSMLALAGATSSFGVLLFSRAVLGLAEGMLWVVTTKLISNWFSLGERGQANGIAAYGQAIGPGVASALIVALINVGGWRFSFWSLALLDLIVIVPLFWFVVRDMPEQHSRVTPVELKYIENGRRILPQRDASKAEWLSIVSNPRFWFIAIATMTMPFCFFAIVTWAPSYMVEVHHFSRTEMGTWSSIGYFLSIPIVAVGVWLADHMRRPGLTAGISMAAAGICLLIALQIPEPHVASLLITTGGGAGVLIGLMMSMTLLQSTFKPSVVGRASGLAFGIGQIGGIISPTLLGWMLDVGHGNYAPSWTLVAIVLLVGAGIFVFALGPQIRAEDLQVATP